MYSLVGQTLISSHDNDTGTEADFHPLHRCGDPGSEGGVLHPGLTSAEPGCSPAPPASSAVEVPGQAARRPEPEAKTTSRSRHFEQAVALSKERKERTEGGV